MVSNIILSLVLTLFISRVHSNTNLHIEQHQNNENSELEIQNSDTDRSARPFPLFTIVRITNQACTPEDPTAGAGQCFTRKQCEQSKGKASGPCANGFGVCCIVTATCEGTITTNNTNFRHRQFPDTVTPSQLELCNVRIQRPNSRTCQVRLDFDQMKLANPDAMGQCQIDRLSINGVSTSVPGNLCGDLTGQHMHLDYGTSDRITLSVITDGSASQEARNWNVRTTYIECNSLLRAPSGCLQYFTQTTGTVRMFNYPFAPHLADLDYSVCIRPEDGAGSITWAPCQGEPFAQAFLMTGDPRAMAGMGGTGNMATPPCITDYVAIFSDEDASVAAGMPNAYPDDRYCGNSFATADAPYQLKTTAKPFIMRVVTNENELMDMMNSGFCLMWRQEPPRNNG